MIKLNSRKPESSQSVHDHSSVDTKLVVPLSRTADRGPKPTMLTCPPEWPSSACCAITGYKVSWKHGFAPGLGWYQILGGSTNTTITQDPGRINGGEASNNSTNNKIMMLSHLHEFWKTGLLAIHPETLRIRCFVPSDVISDYDDREASFPKSGIPDKFSLRIHYEKCVWVNFTACISRITLEFPSTTDIERICLDTFEETIKKAQAFGVVDATIQEYCTQACLSGLKHGAQFDEKCPNYPMHYKSWSFKPSFHPLDCRTFTLLVQRQLEIDQSLFCHQPTVSVKGHHAEFFKITLAGFGYTFCAKGVAISDQHRLMNEYIMYQHMKDLQGVCVPVCLGLFALQRPFGSHNISGLEITHVLLMSNAGASVEENDHGDETRNMPSEDILDLESGRTMNEIRSAGVDRYDRRTKHLYWNAERKRVFYIDFEKNNLNVIAEPDSGAASGSLSTRSKSPAGTDG